MIESLPLEIILEIVSYLRNWKDVLSLKDVKNERIFKIISIREEKMFEERKISNDYVKYDLDNQINKEGEIVKITYHLPFEHLPWEYQTTKICKRAIKADYRKYEYVKNKTNEIRLFAANYHARFISGYFFFRDTIDTAFVSSFSFALKYAENQTPEMCLLAVEKNGHTLGYVKDQTEELCLQAVKNDGLSLKFVKDQTKEICIQAVKNNGFSLKFVKDQTEEICVQAVKKNGCALMFVKEQTEKICIQAVKNNAYALEYVKEQTFEICFWALYNRGDAKNI